MCVCVCVCVCVCFVLFVLFEGYFVFLLCFFVVFFLFFLINYIYSDFIFHIQHNLSSYRSKSNFQFNKIIDGIFLNNMAKQSGFTLPIAKLTTCSFLNKVAKIFSIWLIIPQTGYHITQPLLHQSWDTGWNESISKKCK